MNARHCVIVLVFTTCVLLASVLAAEGLTVKQRGFKVGSSDRFSHGFGKRTAAAARDYIASDFPSRAQYLRTGHRLADNGPYSSLLERLAARDYVQLDRIDGDEEGEAFNYG
jgi:hypothetical protein